MENNISRGASSAAKAFMFDKKLFDFSFENTLGDLSVKEGRLLFYYTEQPFALRAALFDKAEPCKLLWQSEKPIWHVKAAIRPQKITLENRAVIFRFKQRGQERSVSFPLDTILDPGLVRSVSHKVLQRVPSNPILQPCPQHRWESQSVFNSAAVYLDGKVHFIYRAVGEGGLSLFGYASSSDGIHIDQRLSQPAYIVESPFAMEAASTTPSAYSYRSGMSWGGCEDPRLSKIDDTLYMTYTAFDGVHPPGVALTSISVKDFLNHDWNWKKPVMISKPFETHKNWVVFPEKIQGKYAILHSVSPTIHIDYFDSLDFGDDAFIESCYQSAKRDEYWDNWVRGVGPSPIKTSEGWLILYHAMDRRDPDRYKVGAMLLDQDDPSIILHRSAGPLLAPDARCENEGFKAGVVYTCGAVVIDGKLVVYYGGADTVVCAAFINLKDLIEDLKSGESPKAVTSLPSKQNSGIKSMSNVTRISENPILSPDKGEPWQAIAAFNPSVVKDGQLYHLLYRAQSSPEDHLGVQMSVSSIGYSQSRDGIHYGKRWRLIVPEEDWEKFGCEDPRVTKIGDIYYIFYTALSLFPFEARGIRVGVAITKDFKYITEKHLVTPFNAKAMALFPEKINGRYAAVLTVDTDHPPAKIALAFFDEIEDIWSEQYWNRWYDSLDEHIIPLLRSTKDHLEVGAAPVKTPLGWLLIYSYIRNYFAEDSRTFGIEAILLDLGDPSQVIGRTEDPLLVPEAAYELKGDVPNVIFPSGALLEGEQLSVYYGAADTTCCAATVNLSELLHALKPQMNDVFLHSKCIAQGFYRHKGNPVIIPRPELSWEAEATFNPAAIYEDGKVHIVYRAISTDNTSTLGYASSRDGFHIDERSLSPIYVPTELFEQKLRPGGSGCEDPRITRMDGRFYMFYAAFDGYTPRVAFTSIDCDDFLNKRWKWATPVVITPPGIDDKDACLLPRKINGQYVIFHRANDCIRVNFVDSLNFGKGQYLKHGGYLIKPRKEYWDNRKFGIAAPPIETEHGWLLFFHRVTVPGNIYKIEALLLDLDDPATVIAETDATLLEPELDYEKIGNVPNVVFPCGAILMEECVYIYYGGADRVVCVAKMGLKEIFKRLGI